MGIRMRASMFATTTGACMPIDSTGVVLASTRSAMPYGIMAFALCGALPGIVVLAAIGANVYWVSLVLNLRHLLGSGVPLPA